MTANVSPRVRSAANNGRRVRHRCLHTSRWKIRESSRVADYRTVLARGDGTRTKSGSLPRQASVTEGRSWIEAAVDVMFGRVIGRGAVDGTHDRSGALCSLRAGSIFFDPSLAQSW
jgi:hypothetical protein